MKIIVVIPAHNEEKNISQVIDKVKKYAENIVVIDDGSKDKTYHQAKKSSQNSTNIYLLRHKTNLGKGAALKTGCLAAIKLGADIIITMDADGQHSASDIPKLIEKLQEENLDIVFGSRQINGKIPWLMFLGNKFLTKTINLFSNICLKDTQSGFRCFKSKVYPQLAWNTQDYAVETEMILNAGKNKLTYNEIPIQTIYKDAYKGTTIIDGIKIILNLIKWKL